MHAENVEHIWSICDLTGTGKREQVSYVPPLLVDAKRGFSYFFINVTLICVKYEGIKYKNLSEVLQPSAGPCPLSDGRSKIIQ